jgi:exoenzyme U
MLNGLSPKVTTLVTDLNTNPVSSPRNTQEGTVENNPAKSSTLLPPTDSIIVKRVRGEDSPTTLTPNKFIRRQTDDSGNSSLRRKKNGTEHLVLGAKRGLDNMRRQDEIQITEKPEQEPILPESDGKRLKRAERRRDLINNSPINNNLIHKGKTDNDLPRPSAGERTIKRAIKLKPLGKTVMLTIDRPPIEEIVFPGGGAKCASLQGVIKAVEETGQLKGVKHLRGSSGGAIATCIVASGVTSDEYHHLLDSMDMPELLGGMAKDGITMKSFALGVIAGANQMPMVDLENKLRESARETVLKRLSEQWDGLTPEAQAELTPINKALKNEERGVTFGDLAALSKHIPEIKQAHMTATAQDCNAHTTLLLINAETFPNLDIASAAHISAALPGVSAPVFLTLPETAEVVRVSDGGMLANVPVDTIIHPKLPPPIPESNKLICIYPSPEIDDALNNKLIVPHGDVQQALRNKAMRGVDLAAAAYYTAQGLKKHKDEILEIQTEIVMPNGETKDFTGLLEGTFNFNMPKEERDTFQNVAYLQTKRYLENREKIPQKITFSCVAEALYALDDATFDTLIKNVDNPDYDADRDAILAARQFRADVNTRLQNLSGNVAVLAAADSLMAHVGTQTDRAALFDQVNALVGNDPNKINYLAYKMSQSNDLRIQHLMDCLKSHYKNKLPLLEKEMPAIHAVVKKGIEGDVYVIAMNTIKDKIYPNITKQINPNKNNIAALLRAEKALLKATTNEDIENAMYILEASKIKNYNPIKRNLRKSGVKSVNLTPKLLSASPLETIKQRMIHDIINPGLTKNQGTSDRKINNAIILDAANDKLSKANSEAAVIAVLKSITGGYKDNNTDFVAIAEKLLAEIPQKEKKRPLDV